MIDINGTSTFAPIPIGDATHEEGFDIIELSDGTLAMVGLRVSRALLYKTDGLGQSPVGKTYGGTTGVQAFNALRETTDGGLIMVGRNGTSLYLVKTDKNGD